MKTQTTKPTQEEKALLIEGKSANRVHPGYRLGTDDWKAEYNMLLMDGVTCAECTRCDKCVNMFGSKVTDTSCQWHPNRFIASAKGGLSE